MRIKNCVLKELPGGQVWLHHTASGYKVRMNAEGAAVLRSMAGRLSAGEMTEQERFVYDKLSAKDIAGPDTGRAEDRAVPAKASSRLETVELEFSGRCNLRCAHCFASLSGKDMDAGTLQKVFAGADALEPVNLILSGGECLMNPLLPDALRGARERLMRVTVMTNATLVTPASAELLRAAGIAKAIVSLDFFEKDHDELRGPGSFRKAEAGIRLLAAAGVPVFVTAMVRESTAGRLEEFTAFCRQELGVSGVRYSSVQPIGRAGGSAGLTLPGRGVRALFGKGALSASDGGDGAFARSSGEPGFTCGAGSGECFISADGKVYACHYFQNLGESMGDLAAGTLEEIYRAYQSGGAMPVALDRGKLAKCAACAHFAVCRGGCRARARLTGGGWYEPDPYSCDIYGAR